jgi:uncharacterized membrane protein
MAKSSDSANYLGQLEDMLEEYLVKKAPALPENVRDIIVQCNPYLTGLLALIQISTIGAIIGWGSFFGAYGYRPSGMFFFVDVLRIIEGVMLIMAIPGLLKRQSQGWKLSFYACLVYLISEIISFNPVGALIVALISLYILFQIKSYYK